MSIPRRGLLAAGLATAVAGAMGVFSTLNAEADEAPAPPEPVAAVADDEPQPPPLLPWGEEPEPVKAGAPGATSASLAAAGGDYAAATTTPARQPIPKWGPKGVLSKARNIQAPLPQPPALEPVPGNPSDVKFHYAGGEQFATNSGAYGNLIVAKPFLHERDYHSLTEIAVMSRDGKQIVEVGWNVDRLVNKDTDPHLFVSYWVDGKGTCYNGCGFKQTSKTVVPGGTLPTGVSKRFGIDFYDNAWWVAYDSEYIGYFAASLWDGKFTESQRVQWFGEVAASTDKPCTDMGNGLPATDDAAARIGAISLVDGPVAVATPKLGGPVKDDPVYTVEITPSKRTIKYGGPGVEPCPER